MQHLTEYSTHNSKVQLHKAVYHIVSEDFEHSFNFGGDATRVGHHS